jgi:hypothetical protein
LPRRLLDRSSRLERRENFSKHSEFAMPNDPTTTDRFKAEMPQIPGVEPTQPATPPPASTAPAVARPASQNPLLPLMVGFCVLAVIFVFGSRWISKHHAVETARPEPTPQIEVPAPPPDPNATLPHASAANPVIGTVTQFAKPWSYQDFFIRDGLTGEDIPATIVRLPGGSASASSGYWAFSRKAPYGSNSSCQLEFVTDLNKLRKDYDYHAATHPLVGNPCSGTLYDPLKTANLPGNVWIRGGITQGSDVRPPFGVEIKIQGRQVLAIRTEG